MINPRHVTLFVLVINIGLSLYNAAREGKGWWSAFLGWTVAAMIQARDL